MNLPACAAHGKVQLQQLWCEELALGTLGQERSSPAALSSFPDGFHLCPLLQLSPVSLMVFTSVVVSPMPTVS